MEYLQMATVDGSARISRLALGAMLMGTRTDEETSFAILDRFVARGGTLIDTADNYAYWLTGSQGGESERLLGRWLRSRGIGEEVVVATKVGGRPARPGTGMSRDLAGQAPDVVRESVRRSLDHLGRERIDLYYSHIPDPAVPVEQVVGTFAELTEQGLVRAWGLSNHWVWQVERARAAGLPGGPAALQYHHSYFRARVDLPSLRSAGGQVGVVTGDHLSYLRAHPEAPLVAYSALLSGAYVRADRPLEDIYRHPGNDTRRAALERVTRETGAGANQVVLSWMIGGDLPIVPLVGASSVGQLDESLDAVDLVLTPEQRAALDEAC